VVSGNTEVTAARKVDAVSIYVAGGGNFGVPGDNPMTDMGGGIYSIEITRPAGFSSFYTFANGACADFSCKENIGGQDCADPNNFNDRFLPAVAQDTVINTCFGECTDLAECSAPTGANVEFCVDVSCVDNVSSVNIFGNNGFPGGDFNGDPNLNQLTDMGNGIYCITLFLNTGDTEYKFFVNGDNFEQFSPGDPGTVSTPDGAFTNRVITVEDGVNQNVLFGFNNGGGAQCGRPGADVEFCVDIGCIMPSGSVNVFGIFPTSFFDPFQNEMMDPDGDGIYCTTVFLNPGTTEFKFIINPGAGVDEINEMFELGDPETVTTPDGQFTNRIIEVVDRVDQTTNYVFNVPGMGTYTEPVVDFPAIDPRCDNGETVTITGGATPEGGVYSGDGVTDNGDGTFEIDLPETGSVDVTYTFTDELGCEAEATATITVDNDAPTGETTDQALTLTNDEPEITLDTADLVTASDACGDVTIEFDRPLTFGGADIGINEVTVTITDVNGLQTVLTVIVTVNFEQPNLACRNNINLTLNDECQGLLLPSMVLSGETALLDFFDFEITVDDADPSNGPIVDGCGEYTNTISQRSPMQQPATLGFTGAFAAENWDVIDTPPFDDQFADVEFTLSTLTLSTLGSLPPFFVAAASYQFSEPGTVAFDYDYNGVDAGFDFAVVTYTFEGALVDEVFFADEAAAGNLSVDAEPGFTLNIFVDDDGFAPFPPNSEEESVLVISNF
ncbi:MAG: hypothetical protein AAF597_08855, partial [Bacteroidota bacterium]